MNEFSIPVCAISLAIVSYSLSSLARTIVSVEGETGKPIPNAITYMGLIETLAIFIVLLVLIK